MIDKNKNIVDGKALAEELKQDLKNEATTLQKPLRLAVIFVGANPASGSFIKRKQAFGKAIGVEVNIFKPDAEIYTSRAKLRSYLADIVHKKANTGIIIQLPLPDELSSRTQYFLDSIVSEKDVDVLSSHAYGKFAMGQFVIQPPLVGTIELILKQYSIDLRRKNIVVIGSGGRLVGRPICDWFLSQDLAFDAITKDVAPADFREKMKRADVIISGVGKAGLVSADMVKDGVVALDAGTSASVSPWRDGSGTSGELKGDLDPEIAKKASLFTPVPGGIGPLTVAMLFKNLITLAKQK